MVQINLDLSVLSVLKNRVGRGISGEITVRLTKAPGVNEIRAQAAGVVMSCETTVPCAGYDGGIDVYAKISDVIEIAGKEQVTLIFNGDESIERVQGRSRTRIRTVGSAEFAQTGDFMLRGEYQNAAEIFDTMIPIVLARCYDVSKPSTSGLMMEVDGDRLCTIGADGTRFNVVYCGASIGFKKEFIPYQLAEAYAIMRKTDGGRWQPVDAAFVKNENGSGHIAIGFKHSSGAVFSMSCPTMDVAFPSHQRLISTPVAGEAVFSTGLLLEELKTVADNRWSAGKVIKLEPHEGEVKLSLQTSDVDIVTTCPVIGELPAMAASDWPSYTATHLLQSVENLHTMGTQEVRFRFAKKMYPTVIEPSDTPSPAYRSILLARSQ